MRPDFVNDVLALIVSNLICQLIYWITSYLLTLLKKTSFTLGGRHQQ